MPLGLNPNDPRVKSAVLAELVEEFWKSDIRQYLRNRAKEESEIATTNLVENAHTLTKDELRDLQMEIWRASKLPNGCLGVPMPRARLI